MYAVYYPDDNIQIAEFECKIFPTVEAAKETADEVALELCTSDGKVQKVAEIYELKLIGTVRVSQEINIQFEDGE